MAGDGGPLNGIFAGDQSLGWPHGVQEDDPPVGWNWSPRPIARRALPDPIPELVEAPVQRLPMRRVAARVELGATARKDRD